MQPDLSESLGVENAFELVNTYKGIPLAYKATLEKIRTHSILMSVEAPSSVCLLWETATILVDDQRSLAFTARVVSFDIRKGMVELADLDPTERGLEIREVVRVEPEAPIPAKISGLENALIGEMLDISLTGISIRTDSLGDPPLGIGDSVRLAVVILEKNVDPSGTITAISPEEGAYRLGIRFTQEETIPHHLASYITHRRAEIHRELQEAYNAAHQDAARQ